MQNPPGIGNPLADTLVREFERMVRHDGSTLRLVSADAREIRVAYHPGIDPECVDGTCTMPHLELQELMNETAHRRAPGLRVVVQLDKA